jgi:hypothetical protein
MSLTYKIGFRERPDISQLDTLMMDNGFSAPKKSPRGRPPLFKIYECVGGTHQPIHLLYHKVMPRVSSPDIEGEFESYAVLITYSLDFLGWEDEYLYPGCYSRTPTDWDRFRTTAEKIKDRFGAVIIPSESVQLQYR